MLYSKTSGSGKPLVLIHGFCENSTCFNKQVFLLEREFSVTVIDLPGAGHSPYLENLTMERMADELHHTLTALNIRDMVLLGHSMGGYVTLAYAKKYGTALKGFGLVHSTANPDNDARKEKRDQAIRVIQEKGFEFYVRNFIPPLFSNEFNDQQVIDDCTAEALRTTPMNLIAQLTAMKTRHSGREFLKETDLPVMILAGNHDPVIPPNDLYEQAADLKNGQLVWLEHSAHMGMLEEPETCAAAIRKFAEYCF